ncbi:MAG TPA: cyclomaltodextrinase N-terminal domain-containing protein, partial [Mucilaginibacter sp.]|nr:cyclomaltodextrinase N-terminal domain-containing protein [Mucilaginibacter sp.]
MKIRLFIFSALALLAVNLKAQTILALERVEPMFWWTGMKNPKLQLIVHGNNIAASSVSFTYPGVKLAAVHKVENPNYLFLDLVISPTAKPGKFTISFKKPAGNLSYVYELKQRNTSPNRAQGVTSKDLIYLLMPDRFSNGDPSNDVKPGML